MELRDFAPGGAWRNGHFQSILASMKLRRVLIERRSAAMSAASREEILDCGDGVRLSCLRAAQPDPKAPLAVLIHGWEGGANSLYMLSTSAMLYSAGFQVCRLQLRDHGDSHGLNEGLFHSCRIDEVVGAVAAIQRSAPGRALCLGGFSLGGNFSLRVAARAPGAGIDIAQVVAICPVLHPPATLDALEEGLWIYNTYFMRKWRRSLRIKHRLWPQRYDLDSILQNRSMRALTEHLVTEYSDFADLQTYLNGYSIIGDRLAGITAPALLLAAEDDPVIPVAHIEQLVCPPAVEILRTPHGGHCGFLESFGGHSWAERVIVHRFGAATGMPISQPVAESNAA